MSAKRARLGRERPSSRGTVPASQRRHEAGSADLDELRRRQDEAFGSGRDPIVDARRAERFLRRVGLALRYGPTKGLPLASLYRVMGGLGTSGPALAQCITLTNQMLGEAHGIEVHVIADRVTVVHRSLVPALYALVRRGRAPDDLAGLSADALVALALLRRTKQVTAGEVRTALGVRFDARHDRAYTALGELTRAMIVDRGPFEVAKRGIPYLSTEGYPYHLFHEAHADLADAGRRLTPAAAGDALIEGYLRGAVFARVRGLGVLFKRVLSPEEISLSLQRLEARGRLTPAGSGPNAIVVYRSTA